jgi:ribonuclease P protein subunit RPR2
MRDFRSNQEVAKERIIILFSEADKTTLGMARRYIIMARKLATKHRVRLTKEQKLLFCKKCNAYFKSGNFSKRLSNGNIVLTCRECGFVRKFVYRK